MKRAMIILTVLVLLLTGCAKPPVEVTDPTDVMTEPAQTTEPTAEVTEPAPEPTEDPTARHLRDNLPTMDGSTSLIPLEAGIRAAIYGKTLDEATGDVVHSTTWQSFYNLIYDEVDLIFSCPLSQMQYDEAEYAGVALKLVPIAMEGFVFVVNADNPVDTLTQEQLKKIYSGEITNWSEVGGLDMPIIAYQRNTDSGSQNFMTEFMGDRPLMEAPVELRPASMSGLMDVIAVNDNSLGAIGYSVYAYAADMYGNGNEIKFIKVDGVAPSKETFASGDYPLMGINYAVYNAQEPADGPVQQLVDWMVSYNGQLAIANAGYVTVMDIGFDYEEKTLSRYQGTGTGPAAQTPASYEYKLYRRDEYGIGTEHLPTQLLTLENGEITYRITGLKDQDLLADIHAFIDAQLSWTGEEGAALPDLLSRLNKDEIYPVYSSGPGWEFNDCYENGVDSTCIATARNGYLSVAVAVCYSYNVMETQTKYLRTETATWDLLTGKRLETEELFCEGVDIDQVLGDYIRRISQEPQNGWGSYYEMKQDFAALPTTGWHLTHDAIYFDYDNPYFYQGACIELDELPDGTLAAEQPRDFSGCFEQEGIAVLKKFRMTDRDTVYKSFGEDSAMALLAESASPYAAAINARMEDYITTYFTYDAVTSYFEKQGLFERNEDRLWFGAFDWDLKNFGGHYLVFQGNEQNYYDENYELVMTYPYSNIVLYDLTTGREISWEDMLLSGWEQEATVLSGGEPCDMPDWDALSLQYIYEYSAEGLWFSFVSEEAYYEVAVPMDYVNF